MVNEAYARTSLYADLRCVVACLKEKRFVENTIPYDDIGDVTGYLEGLGVLIMP